MACPFAVTPGASRRVVDEPLRVDHAIVFRDRAGEDWAGRNQRRHPTTARVASQSPVAGARREDFLGSARRPAKRGSAICEETPGKWGRNQRAESVPQQLRRLPSIAWRGEPTRPGPWGDDWEAG